MTVSVGSFETFDFFTDMFMYRRKSDFSRMDRYEDFLLLKIHHIFYV